MSTDRAKPLVLYAGAARDWEAYRRLLPPACAAVGAPIRLVAEAAPDQVDYVVYAPTGDLQDFGAFTATKAVLSLWAGVERIVGNPTLTQPLVRMSDHGLVRGMVEWVTGHVLRHHLGMDAHILGQDGVWRDTVTPPLARDRTVAILGLGALGGAAAVALAGLGFRVLGWSRRPRTIPGVHCHAGTADLTTVLAEAQILVLLLPATPETQHVISAATLAALPHGAVLLNPGRGSLVDDGALLSALDSGRLAHATLDVFKTEPLPPGHPYWHHPKVTVTPHIASATRPETAVAALAESIAQGEAGQPFTRLVDRQQGY